MGAIEIVSIVNSVGVIGTLIISAINLISLRKSEQYSREYNLKMNDYEKRRDFLLTNVADFMAKYNPHKYSYMAMTDEEYDGKDLEIYNHFYELETCYYKIKLHLNPENKYTHELTSILDVSMKTMSTIRSNCSSAEMMSHIMRNSEAIAPKYYDNLKMDYSVNTDEKLSHFIEEAKNHRDEHLKEYLNAIEKITERKEQLSEITQKYLLCEREIIVGGK